MASVPARRTTFTVPRPGLLLDVARGAVLWSLDTGALIGALPSRIDGLLNSVDALLARISAVADGASTVVESAAGAAADANAMIADLAPIAERALPLGKVFVDNFSEEELRAAIRMVDHLPEILERMEALMPILAQMDSIAPELHQLLEVTTDVRRAVIGIPGFKFFRNRGEDKEVDDL